MTGFSFKGVHSSSFGLAVKTKALPFAANTRYEVVEIPGKDGDYYFPIGKEDLKPSFECFLAGTYAQRKVKKDEINAWLTGVGSLVADLDNRTYAVKALNISQKNMELNLEIFTVDFVCEVGL